MTIVTAATLIAGVWLRGPGAGTVSAGAIPTPALLGSGTSVLSSKLVPLTGSVIPHLAQARRDIALANSRALGVDISLRLRDSAGLDRYLAQVYDRHSPLYHHWLTPRQFRERFAQTPAQQQQVVTWLQARGLHVMKQFANGLMVTASGTVGQIDKAFGTRLYRFHQKSHSFFANAGPVHLPAWVAGRVMAVDGLSDRDIAAGDMQHAHRRLHDGSGPAGGLSPQNVSTVYDLGGFYQANVNGAGVTVGIVASGDIANSDIVAYEQHFGLNSAIHRVGVSDPNGTGSPKVDSEFEMDTEMVAGMAPGAQILVYEDANTRLSGIAVTFNQMVSENKASVLSTSVSGAEEFWNGDVMDALHVVFKEAAVQGQSIFTSTGDDGAYAAASTDKSQANTLAVRYPGSDNYVTSVGGTSLTVNSDGSYGSEAAWSDRSDPTSLAGGGGGLSKVWRRLEYQTGPGTDNQYSDGSREVPDVSADADPNTGYDFYLADGDHNQPGWGTMGGTSASAPLWAAFCALLDGSLGGRIGFMNPTLYALGTRAKQFQYPALNDVTRGDNLYYPATSGYDLASGLGSFDGVAVNNDINAMGGPINGAPTPGPTATATPRPSPTSVPGSGVTITGTGISHLVSGKQAFTHALRLQEQTWFVLAYKSTVRSTAHASLQLWYNKHWYAVQSMTPIKYSDGSPGFQRKLRFRHTDRLGTWYVKYTVTAGSVKASKTVKFTVQR